MANVRIRKLTDNVTLISTSDLTSRKFENIWDIPEGINYNAYLIADGNKYLLIDSTKDIYSVEFINVLKQLTNGGELSHIIVLHAEPDHCGTIRDLAQTFTKAKIISTRTASIFLKNMFDITPEIAKDGDEIEFSRKRFKVIELPWIHWPDTMALLLEDEGILFSSDAFGAFGARDPAFDDEVQLEGYIDQMKEYFATIVVNYRQMVLKDIARFKPLLKKVSIVAPAHGVVYRSHVEKIVNIYEYWSKLEKEEKVTILYASMYGLTKKVAFEVQGELLGKVDKVVIHDVVDERIGNILADILDSSAVIFITPAYEMNIFPPFSYLMNLIRTKKMGSGKIACAVTTKLWGSTAAKQLEQMITESDFTLIDRVHDFVNYPTNENMNQFFEVVRKVIESIKR